MFHLLAATYRLSDAQVLDLSWRRARQMVRQIERDRYDQAIVQARLTEEAVLRVMLPLNSTKRVWLPAWQTWDDLTAAQTVSTLSVQERWERLPWRKRGLPPDLVAYMAQHGSEGEA